MLQGAHYLSKQGSEGKIPALHTLEEEASRDFHN